MQAQVISKLLETNHRHEQQHKKASMQRCCSSAQPMASCLCFKPCNGSTAQVTKLNQQTAMTTSNMSHQCGDECNGNSYKTWTCAKRQAADKRGMGLHTLIGKVTLLVSFSREEPEYLKRLMCNSSTWGRRYSRNRFVASHFSLHTSHLNASSPCAPQACFDSGNNSNSNNNYKQW